MSGVCGDSMSYEMTSAVSNVMTNAMSSVSGDAMCYMMPRAKSGVSGEAISDLMTSVWK